MAQNSPPSDPRLHGAYALRHALQSGTTMQTSTPFERMLEAQLSERRGREAELQRLIKEAGNQ